MDSDSKDGKNGDPVKEEVKGSKRSARKNKATFEEKPKEKEKEINIHRKSELPSALLPKFPSQKIVKKRPSTDNIFDEMPMPMCPTDKLLNEEEEKSPERDKFENLCEDLVIDEQAREEEIEQMKETMEPAHASPSDQPSMESNDPKKIKQEKPEKLEKPEKMIVCEKKMDKPSSRDKKSGRSEDRKKNRKETMSSDDKKSSEDKKKDAGKRKVSAEDANSDEMRKSARKSKRLNRKSIFRPPVQKTGQQGLLPSTQGPQPSAYHVLAPPLQTAAKTDRSLKLLLVEPKSYDERGKKQPLQQQQHQMVKKEGVIPGQQQKVQLKPTAPNATLPPPHVAPGTENQKSQQLQQKKKKMGFLKSVYNKTKFWGRKSDCVADPTKEMLAKIYVMPEYDQNNAKDFLPDPHLKFTEEDWNERLKNNFCKPGEIFLSNRPFWLTRSTTDTIPKIRIQLHRPLKQKYQGDPTAILPKLPRRDLFFDPKNDSVDKMKAIDKTIGVDLTNQNKNSELDRVSANTFHATVMFEVNKIAWDEQQKKHEMDGKQDTRKRNGKKEKDQKSSAEELLKKVSFTIKETENVTLMLNLYNRKDRPYTGIPSAACSNRFKTATYRMGKKIPRKATSPAPSSSPASVAPASTSASLSTSSSAEGKKT